MARCYALSLVLGFSMLAVSCGDEHAAGLQEVCSGGLERCGEQCVDLKSNVQHCGACGFNCAILLPHGSVRCGGTAEAPVCEIELCDPGYVQRDGACMPRPDVSCLPCTDDAECYGGACLEMGGARGCLMECEPSEGCRTGYECVEVEEHGTRCVPGSASCACTPASVGAARVCERGSEEGTCRGTELCEAGGWGACDAATPADETCDGVDNNCDGEVDEGFLDGDLYVQDEHCGACGLTCAGALPDATATCEVRDGTPRCVVASCDPGFVPAGPFACVPAVGELCSVCAVDTDCVNPGDRCLSLSEGSFCGQDCAAGNGHGLPGGECPAGFSCAELGEGVRQCAPVSGSCSCLPEQDGRSRACTVMNPSGTCTGVEICDPEVGWSACDAATPADESCDGLDNDCNGLVDDDLGAPACPLQDGVCAGATQVCAGSAGLQECNAASYGLDYETAEVSCDGLDNDCDGTIDEVDLDQDLHIDEDCLLYDGELPIDDCDDRSPLVYEDAPEICGDSLDNDCNGVAEDRDVDGDSHIAAACLGDDCNDNSALAHPGLSEVCGDALDNDCDGSIDNKDTDADGFRDEACGGNDCDDSRDYVHPGGVEACNGFDDDCNGTDDDKDLDHDGFRDEDCGGDDCDDGNPFANPGLIEICGNTVDEDCSGAANDRDLDEDGAISTSCGGDDCDDGNPLALPGATEVRDAADNDCDGLVDEELIPAGTVIVSEVMQNPNAVGDSVGEWFEVYNASDLPVNLDSWVVYDRDGPDRFTVNEPAGLIVPPGGVAVLCREDDPTLNGGVACDHSFDDFLLANADDEVILSLDGVEIDRVEYGLLGFPNPTGASMTLDPGSFTATANNTGANWCTAPASQLLPSGDRGSPGIINKACAGGPAVTSVQPRDGLAAGGESIVLQGSGLTSATAVTAGGLACTAHVVVDDNQITCVTPAHAAGAVDIQVTVGAASDLLTAAYRYTAAGSTTIDWCDLQWPPTLHAAAGGTSGIVYGRVHSPTVTEPAGAPADILAQLGFGPAASDPRTTPGWVWRPAFWNRQYYANDEFLGTLNVPQAGTYSYTYRFSDDGGLHYFYCDFDPGTADGFSTEDLGTLTVD